MKRKFLFILLALLMLGTVLFIYVHAILLPIKVKEFVEVKAQDYLQRKITIGSIDFQVFKGFSLSQIKIYKENNTDLLFFAEEARFNVLFAALFKQKALIIPSLYIKGPSFHLIRQPDGSFNVLNMISSASAKSRAHGYNFLIAKISIEKGALDYSDLTGESAFFDTFQDIRLTSALSLNRTIGFSLEARSEIKESQIELMGKYDLSSKALVVQSRLKNFPLSDYLALYWSHPDLHIKGLAVSTDSLSIQKKGAALNVLGSIEASETTIRTKRFEFHGPFSLKNLKLQVRDGTVKLTGLVHTDAKLSSSDALMQYAAKIQLAIRSFIYADSHYRAILDADLHELSITTPDGNSRCDRMYAQEMDVSGFDALTITTKNIQCANNAIELADKTSIESSLSLANLRLLLTNNKLLADSAVTLTNAHVKTFEGRTLETHLSSPSLNIEMVDGRIKAKAALDLTNTFLVLDSARSFNGNPKLDLQLDYQMNAEEPLKFMGELVLADAQLKGFTPLEVIENINGHITIENDSLASRSIEFKALNTVFTASGRLDSIKSRTGAVTLSSQHVDLSLLSKFFPAFMEKHSIAVDGAASVEFNYAGPLEPIVNDNIRLNAHLKGANVDLTRFKTRLENLTGAVNFESGQLSWNELTLNYKNENVITSGLLKLSDIPKLSAHVKTSNFDAKARLTFEEEIIFLDEIKGRYGSSSLDATGRIHHNGKTDLDIKGQLNFEDARGLPKPLADRLSALHPIGKLNYNASFTGDINEWRSAAINVNANADAIRMISYPLLQVDLSYRQANGRISLFNLRSIIYEGIFNIDGEGDLADERIAFTSHTKLEQMDLIEYRKDKETKNKYLSGKLDCAFTMKGFLLEPPSYRGIGALKIREAYLGQLIPQISSAIFTDGEADFQIVNSKILTDNARLISDSLDLRAVGWVNFNKEINFDIVPTLKDKRLSNTQQAKIDPSVLLSKAVSIKMTGTLEHPVKEVSTSTAGVLKNTTGVIAEGIGNILGDLF